MNILSFFYHLSLLCELSFFSGIKEDLKHPSTKIGALNIKSETVMKPGNI